MEFHTVKTGLLCSSDCLCVIFYIILHFLRRKHSWFVIFSLKYRVGFRLEVGWGNWLISAGSDVGRSARMMDLCEHITVVFMHCIGQFAQISDSLIVINICLPSEIPVRLDADGPTNQHCSAALSASFIICDFFWSDRSVVCHVHSHRCHDKSVFQC